MRAGEWGQVTTQWTVDHYRQNHGYTGPIEILPRLVDVELFKRRRHDGHWLLYVGRIAPEKRVFELARVAAELGRPLHIVGDYDHPRRDKPPLDRAIDHYNAVVTFSVAQTMTGVARAYRMGDILVSASRRETFCRVFLEALASGMAVASTAIGGCRDWASEWVEFVDDLADLSGAVDRAKPLTDEQYNDFVAGYSWQSRACDFEKIVKGVV